jgi:hypothetical protein
VARLQPLDNSNQARAGSLDLTPSANLGVQCGKFGTPCYHELFVCLSTQGKPSSTPPARACSVSRMGSCKVNIFCSNVHSDFTGRCTRDGQRAGALPQLARFADGRLGQFEQRRQEAAVELEPIELKLNQSRGHLMLISHGMQLNFGIDRTGPKAPKTLSED